MRVQTSAHTEIVPALLFTYEPHRLVHTAAAAAVIEPGPSLWDFLSKEEILGVLEAWSRRVGQQLRTWNQEQGLAGLYREFGDEDRDLAEAGLGEYRLLLDDADRT